MLEFFSKEVEQSGVNTFAPEFMPTTVGLILAALFVGGGSNLLHQIVLQKSPLLALATGLSAVEVAKGEGLHSPFFFVA